MLEGDDAQASSDRKQIDIGANLYIGGLDPNVDERMLYDTFTAFGTLVQTAKVRLGLIEPVFRKTLMDLS